MPYTWNYRLVQELISALLLLLFLYTALSKLLDYGVFQGQLEAQHLPDQLTTVLAWALPAVEGLACGLLFFRRTRRYGLWLSVGLMAVFSGYVALVLGGAFGMVPCSCGGVLRSMGWKTHLVFNIVFLTLAGWGLHLESLGKFKHTNQLTI